MKFNINLDEDFDLKFGCHDIHVKFVDKSHSALVHTEECGKEETESSEVSEELEIEESSPEVSDEEVIDEKEVTSDFGCYFGDKYTIYVRKSDPYSIRLSTLFHELIHVIEQIYILDFDHKELNIVSEVFAQVLIDNWRPTKKKMEKDRIKCGNCNSEYSPRKFVDGSLNYTCPVCEQQKDKTNESVELENRKILHD